MIRQSSLRRPCNVASWLSSLGHETDRRRTFGVLCFEGDPGRDPRGHTITVAFMAWAPSRAACNARAGDDAAEACFFPVERLPSMAFDHLKVRRYEFGRTGD